VFALANILSAKWRSICWHFARRPVSYEISPVSPDLANQRAAFEYAEYGRKNIQVPGMLGAKAWNYKGYYRGPCRKICPGI
jgi:hypothetical protein